MRIVSSAAAKAAQAPPSLFCDPILRQHKLPAPSAEIGGVRQMQAQPLRDTRRGRLAGGREAGSELGEDAHGELWMRGHGDG